MNDFASILHGPGYKLIKNVIAYFLFYIGPLLVTLFTCNYKYFPNTATLTYSSTAIENKSFFLIWYNKTLSSNRKINPNTLYMFYWFLLQWSFAILFTLNAYNTSFGIPYHQSIQLYQRHLFSIESLFPVI